MSEIISDCLRDIFIHKYNDYRSQSFPLKYNLNTIQSKDRGNNFGYYLINSDI